MLVERIRGVQRYILGSLRKLSDRNVHWREMEHGSIPSKDRQSLREVGKIYSG